jgi:hypothetical protein
MKSINKTPAKSSKFVGLVIGDDEYKEQEELNLYAHGVIKVKVGFVEIVLSNLILMMNKLVINKSYRFPMKIVSLQ